MSRLFLLFLRLLCLVCTSVFVAIGTANAWLGLATLTGLAYLGVLVELMDEA